MHPHVVLADSSNTTARRDSYPYSPVNAEIAQIAKKRGSNRTESDDKRLRELEYQRGLYLDGAGSSDPPGGRDPVDDRKGRAQAQARAAGFAKAWLLSPVDRFDYDREALGTTVEELGKSAQFTVGVVVQRSRVLRTRPLFDPWMVAATLDCDDELIDQEQLETWLDIGGRRIGLGDWRPEKSGSYGRFTLK